MARQLMILGISVCDRVRSGVVDLGMTVHDITYVHPRARQETTVAMLDMLRARADTGEMVGALVVWIDSKGIWHHDRDSFVMDHPGMIGYLEICKQNLVHRYLTGVTLTPDDPNHLSDEPA